MKISINNRHCNWFVYLGRPIFLVNRIGASVCNPDHICGHACTYRCYTRDPLAFQSATSAGSSLLDSSMLLLFREAVASPILFTSSPTLFARINSNCNRFNHQKRLILSTSATSNNWPLFLITRRLCNYFNIPHDPENMSHEIFITTFFYIWTWYKPINGIFGTCCGISTKI